MPPKSSKAASRARPPGHADERKIAQLERQTGEPIADVVADAERRAQAQFEGSVYADSVEFYGEKYLLAQKIGYLPLLKFAHTAAQGADADDMEGMAAMYDMLQGCFERGQPCGKCVMCAGDDELEPDPGKCISRAGDEWPRFERHAIREAADAEDLLNVITDVMEIVSARPTRARSGSSQPAQRTSARSKDNSSGQAAGLTPIDELAR
jgi:hypothetical protein